MKKFKDKKFLSYNNDSKIKNGVLARSGVQVYLGQEIGMEQDKVYHVIRPKKVVQDLAEKLNDLPITYGHIGRDEDIADRQRGKIINSGFFEKNGEIFLNAKLDVDNDIDFLKNDCWVKELSMGYDADLEEVDDGVLRLTNIEPHHLAVVPFARGGSELKILDSANNINNMEGSMHKNNIEGDVKTIVTDEVKKMAVEAIKENDNKQLKGIKDFLNEIGIKNISVDALKKYIGDEVKNKLEEDKKEFIYIVNRASKALPKNYDFSDKSQTEIINDFLKAKYDNFDGMTDQQKRVLFDADPKIEIKHNLHEKQRGSGGRPYENF